MKKNSKKRLFLSLILLVGIGSTIAYFYSTTTFSNIFNAKQLPTIITKEKFKSPEGWEPGDTTEKTITTKNYDSEEDICIRVKFDESWESANEESLALYQNGNKAAIINFANQDKWLKATDGWYYYQENLETGDESVTPISSVTFNSLIEADETCVTTTNDETNEITKRCYQSGDGYNGATYTLDITTEAIECDKVSDRWNPSYPFTSYIKALYGSGDTSLVMDDPVGNMRYIGQDPDNYVYFNEETWRIIGVFEVDDGNGNIEERVKLIRSENLDYKNYGWDSTTSTINNGHGINEWSQATLMSELNGDYLTYKTGTTSWLGYFETSSSLTYNYKWGLQTDSQKLIDNAVWYLGAPNNNEGTISNDTMTASNVYKRERSTYTGKVCTSGDDCNDTVTRTTSWTGKVGLIYPSDYMYSTSGGSVGRSTCLNVSGNKWFGYYFSNSYGDYFDCRKYSWIYNNEIGNYIFTISPWADTSSAYYVTGIGSEYDYEVDPSRFIVNHGTLNPYYAFSGDETVDVSPYVYPVVYLKADVLKTGGTGTYSSTYKIDIE